MKQLLYGSTRGRSRDRSTSDYHPGSAWQFGFVMEQVLGHVSHYKTLRDAVQREPGVLPHWVEVNYSGDGWLERFSQLPSSLRGTARSFIQVRQGVRGRQFDALLFHTQKPAVFQWDLMARVPTVLSLDVTPRQYDELGTFYGHQPDSDDLVGRIKHALNCQTFSLARGIVAWSHWVKDSLIADYGVAEDKVYVIPPGVDLSKWTPSTRDNIDSRRLPRVLFVGGDFDRKGGALLLDWFRQHGRGRCELDLVTKANIEQEPGMKVHRNVVGNSPEARALFTSADLFVLPSLAECFGIASVEAMASGLPVVASNVGGARDIVEQGQTGFLMPPNDPRALANALEILLENTARRRAMGERGRAKAEQSFDGIANARSLLRCLEAAARRQVHRLRTCR